MKKKQDVVTEPPAPEARVYTVTEKEAMALAQIMACQRACEKLVQQVIKHYEDADISEQDWWATMRQKYGFEVGKDWTFDSGNKTIKELEPKNEIDTFIDKFTRRRQFADWLRSEETK